MNRLSDDELEVIINLARPLPPDRRSAFLEAVIAEAVKFPEHGPGLISRIGCAIQKSYFFTNAMPRAPQPAGTSRPRGRPRKSAAESSMRSTAGAPD
jgi:hypothetical protein